MPIHTRFLGIDPGLRFMGWGVIELVGTKLSHVANGAIASNDRLSLAERLVELEAGLVAVIDSYQPHTAAVENAFVARDAAAALKLGQARAVALLVPARAGLSVSEYAPNHVKKAVVGAGHAGKAQIQMMVEMLLPGSRAQNEHAADALAIAICHAHAGAGAARVAQALMREAANR